MNLPENRKTNPALIVALISNVVLASALLFFWWHSHVVASIEPRSSSQEDSSRATSVMNSSGEINRNSMNNEDAAESEAPLAPFQLTPQRMQAIGVKLGTAEIKTVANDIRVTGNVDVNERTLSTVQLRFPGWIRKVFVDATYDHVQIGQPLFTIYSPDLVTTEQEYLLARKNQQDLQHSEVAGVSAGADTLVTAARERLLQWNVPESEIAKLESTGKPITDLTINSPVSGYIIERNALPNLYVQPDSKLYAVADLSAVWIYAQVFQMDLGRIKPGDQATVTVDTYPGKTFHGKVDLILPQVDMSTRAARVRLVFPNPGLKLKPGMFVNVVLDAPVGKSLVVPASSILHSGVRNLVFIHKGEGNFEPREVKLGARVGNDYVVMEGLKANESLVTSANFLLDSEAELQAAAGAFVPPPPGAGANTTMNGESTAPKGSVELITEPSPPQRGNNIFRVKLTGANGVAINGAQVNVTFFMAAMPAMGMAAMKTSVDLADKGNGMYEGKGELGSGGTWQVSITARQNGSVIASKQFTVEATGGM